MSCKCQGCGNQYRIDVGVPDQVWESIKPDGKFIGAGLLCGSCIMSRLEAFGEYGSYELVERVGVTSHNKRKPKRSRCSTGSTASAVR